MDTRATNWTEASPEIYLDNNATTQPLPEVIEAMARVWDEAYGNASSLHRAGERARELIREARERVSEIVTGRAETVVFTGGTTEANNSVLLNLLYGAFKGFRLVTTAVEHSSVLAPASFLESKGVDVVILPVGRDGELSVDSLTEAILPGRTLVSIQWANNETGVIQPILELANAAKEAGAFFHSDAAQAVGKIAIDLSETPVDLLSISGHKIHGPTGIGALLGPGIAQLHPIMYGGPQEGSLRPGTENVPGIVGLGVALDVRRSRFDRVNQATAELRDLFEAELVGSGLAEEVNGATVRRLPNTSNVRFAKIDGEALAIRLDQAGVRCSQSSACTNRRPEPSYVLRAMGLSEPESFASVRFGFSEMNTGDEVSIALERIREIHASLSAFAVA